MDLTESGIIRVCILLQPLNAYAPMVFKAVGKVKDASSMHPLNAPLPMDVSLSGKVTDARDVQPAKASFPMVYTELGIFTTDSSEPSLVSFVQPLKTPAPMDVSLSGKVTEVSLVHPENA